MVVTVTLNGEYTHSYRAQFDVPSDTCQERWAQSNGVVECRLYSFLVFGVNFHREFDSKSPGIVDENFRCQFPACAEVTRHVTEGGEGKGTYSEISSTDVKICSLLSRFFNL